MMPGWIRPKRSWTPSDNSICTIERDVFPPPQDCLFWKRTAVSGEKGVPFRIPGTVPETRQYLGDLSKQINLLIFMRGSPMRTNAPPFLLSEPPFLVMALTKVATPGFSMNREKDEKGNLSVDTRRVTTENAPFSDFREARKDKSGVLSGPSLVGTDNKKTAFSVICLLNFFYCML